MINPKMREHIQERLTARNQDALVVYSAGILSILAPSYLHYITGVRPAGPQVAVINRQGQARLLVQPAWDKPRIASETWIEDVRASSNLCSDLVAAMKELCPSGRVTGAGLGNMPENLYAGMEAVAEPVPGNDLVEDIARVKSPEELALIREVAGIADAGFLAMLEHARPGVREFELIAQMEYRMRMEGADDNFILISTGPHNSEMHEPTERVLQPGDIVIGEITPVKDGQFMQLCRTVVLGEPNVKVRDTYDMLLKAFRASLAEVRVGATSSLMSKAMNRVISEAGYAKFCYPPYMRARGHGFGVGSIAPGGVIDDDSTKPFECNQAVVVHPNQYLEDTGYLACGETVVVTENGCERLAQTDTRLYSVEI